MLIQLKNNSLHFLEPALYVKLFCISYYILIYPASVKINLFFFYDHHGIIMYLASPFIKIKCSWIHMLNNCTIYHMHKKTKNISNN